ncbi:MAG: nitroreductase family protein [Eubacteriaceae bacterium]|jgi:nitroreductase|nr:nitroreductase family protein [Eubacteriaceae bacterium]
MELQTAIDNRQSIRRFKEGTIPDEDIREIIDAARKAPSGHNLQPWYFVAIKDKALKDKIADAMEAKAAEAARIIKEIYVDGTREATDTPFSHGDLPKAATDPDKFMKFTERFISFSRNAPVLILVLSTEPAEVFFADAVMRTEKIPEDFIGQVLYKFNPTMQSIGAAVENMMLKAVELGYGACWQSGPNACWKEVTAVMKEAGFEKEGYTICAYVPMGIPEDDQKSPNKLPLEDVMTIIG